jgi:hypothetical protein
LKNPTQSKGSTFRSFLDGLPEVGQRLDGVDVLDAGVGEVVLELDGLH